MHEQIIREVFTSYLQREDFKLEVLERFLGGMSNFTYHVRVNNVDYVIRIANETGKDFVDYTSEKLHLHLVEEHGLTSKTYYYDLGRGHKISAYIPGTNLINDFSEEDYENIAKLLRLLHKTNIKALDYDMVGRFVRYEKLVPKLSKEYYTLKQFWLELYEKTYVQFPKVFTHGDAQRSNIIKGPTGYILVDFEFAGMNDPYYDIASFGNIDFNDSLRLLTHYLKNPPRNDDYRRVYFYRMFQVLQWHVVATYKESIGQSAALHIDFAKHAAKYLKFAQDYKEKIISLT